MEHSGDVQRLLRHMLSRHPRKTWVPIAVHIFEANGGNGYRRASRAWATLSREGLTTTHTHGTLHAPYSTYKALTERGLEVAQQYAAQHASA